MNDDFCGGLNSMGSFTISGTWDDSSPLREMFVRRVQIITHGFTLFGISLWAERMDFDAEGEWSPDVGDDGLTTMTANMRVVSPVEMVRAEWWRRGLYHALRPFWRLYVRMTSGPEGTR